MWEGQLQTLIEYSVGEGVGFLKTYIQILTRSLWVKPQGKLLQRMVSLSALPDTMALLFSPEYEQSF